MTAAIVPLSGPEVYDLIFPEYLSMLSTIDQETMARTMRNSSQVWLGYDDNLVLAVWGLIPPSLLSERAYLWLFTTEHLRGHEFVFIRYSQRAVEEMLELFPVIVGNTLATNHRAIRWLRWLGAEFREADTGVLYFEIKHKWQQQSAQSA